MFKKMLLVAFCSIFANVAYADKGYQDITSTFELPPHMKNCTITRLEDDSFVARVLYVTACPTLKTSTTRTGKHPVTVNSNSILDEDDSTVVDSPKTIEVNGEKYIKVK